MTTAASCIDPIECKQLGQMLVLFIVAYSEREQPHKCPRQKKKEPPHHTYNYEFTGKCQTHQRDAWKMDKDRQKIAQE